MRQHVVGEDQVGHAALLAKLLGQRAAEEGVSVGTPAAIAALRRRLGRVDAQDRHAARDEVAQQIAVVAGDLDHQRAGIEAKPTRISSSALARECASSVLETDEKYG